MDEIMGGMLREKRKIKVIKKNEVIIDEMKGEKGIKIIEIGGKYQEKLKEFLGILKEEELERIREEIEFV